MKAIDIFGIYESLTTLADKDLDLNTACDIAKDIQNLSIPKQILEQKRNKLIQEYGEKDDEGNLIETSKSLKRTTTAKKENIAKKIKKAAIGDFEYRDYTWKIEVKD